VLWGYPLNTFFVITNYVRPFIRQWGQIGMLRNAPFGSFLLIFCDERMKGGKEYEK